MLIQHPVLSILQLFMHQSCAILALFDEHRRRIKHQSGTRIHGAGITFEDVQFHGILLLVPRPGRPGAPRARIAEPHRTTESRSVRPLKSPKSVTSAPCRTRHPLRPRGKAPEAVGELLDEERSNVAHADHRGSVSPAGGHWF